MANSDSLPDAISVSTRGIKTKLKKHLSQSGEDASDYVLRLVRADLGMSSQMPGAHSGASQTFVGSGKFWRTIAATGDAYEVSKYGQVRRTATERKLTVRISRRRAVVHLQVNKKTKTFLVRKLVAEAFLGPIPNGWWVMHQDGKPENCKASNLLVVSPSEGENRAAKRSRRRAEKARRAKSR